MKLLLSIIIFLTVLCTNAVAQTTIGGLYFVLSSDSTAVVCAQYQSKDTLTSVIIPETVNIDGKTARVTNVCSEGFAMCKSLRTIKMPASITDIEQRGFMGCESLESIVLHEGILSIGQEAFEGCSSLTSIHIPASAKNIGFAVFAGCSKLSEVSVAEGNGFYSVDNDMLIVKERFVNVDDGTIVIGKNWSVLFCPPTSEGEIVIGDTISHIAYKAFYGCDNLSSVTIGRNVESVGSQVFAYCSQLKLNLDENNKHFKLFGNSLYDSEKNLVACGMPKDGELVLMEGMMGIREGALTGVDIKRLVFPLEFGISNANDADFRNIASLYAELSIPSLKEIVVKSPYAPINALSERLFSDDIYANTKLVIPALLKNIYWKYSDWKQFKNVEMVETDYSLYSASVILANHEATKGHYFKPFETSITPKTDVFLSFAERHSEYFAGDTLAVAGVLANAWYGYLDDDKKGTYQSRAAENIVCANGTIYLLDEIDEDDFMNFILHRSAVKVAETKNLALHVDSNGNKLYMKSCIWDIADCGENISTPNGRYFIFTPTSSTSTPRAGFDFSDMSLLSNYPYEVTVVTVPAESEEDLAKDYMVRVLHDLPGMSTNTYIFGADDSKDFIMEGDKCDTLKLELNKTEVSNGIIIQTRLYVGSKEKDLYMRTMRIAYVSISPKSSGGSPNGIEDIIACPSKKPADTAIYDLTGRRLNSKPERGIYIQGGKKYWVKK